MGKLTGKVIGPAVSNTRRKELHVAVASATKIQKRKPQQSRSRDFILKVLARGPNYAGGILKRGHRVRRAIRPGGPFVYQVRCETIYRWLNRMVGEGLIRPTYRPQPWTKTHRMRRYYELTEAGLRMGFERLSKR